MKKNCFITVLIILSMLLLVSCGQMSGSAVPSPTEPPDTGLAVVESAPGFTHIADGFAGSGWGSTWEEVQAAHPDNVWHIVTVAGGPGMYQADAYHLFDSVDGGLIGGGYRMGPEHTVADIEAPEIYLNAKNFLCQLYGEPSAAQGSVYEVIAGEADSCREDWVFPLQGGFCTVQLSLDPGGETRVNYGFSSPNGAACDLSGVTPATVADSAGYTLKEYSAEELDSHMLANEGFNGNQWGSTVEQVLENNPYPLWYLVVQSVELAGHSGEAVYGFHYENGGLNTGMYRFNPNHEGDGAAIYLDIMAQVCDVYGESYLQQAEKAGRDPETEYTIDNVLAGTVQQCMDQWQYQGENGEHGSLSLQLMPSGEVTLTVFRSDLM